MEITVIGGGVIGLTTAIELRRAGHDAHVVAAARAHDATSVVAGAIWGPTSVAPQHRTGPWALESRRRYVDIATDPTSGVAPMTHVDLQADDESHWGETTPWVTRLGPDEVPAGYGSALAIDGFRIDPPVYLSWLERELDDTGGTIEVRRLERVEEAAGTVIVNCSGLGARELVGDQTMFPIRGQMVLVSNDAPDGPIRDGIADETDQDRISYVYPRTNELYVGGARQVGADDLEVDDDLTQRILADAPRLQPAVLGRTVVDVRVGLRPGRPEVRLETDRTDDGRTLIHNYGHGGAGFIMSWGCAAEVVSLLN